MTEAERQNAELVRLVFDDGWNQSDFEFLAGRTADEIPFHYNGASRPPTAVS